MTEIDVPDWVVQLAVDEMTRVPPESEGQWFSRDIEEVMRAALTAALGAWVVPEGRLSDFSPALESVIEDREWLTWANCDESAVEAQRIVDHARNVLERLKHKDESIYSLRQEKPDEL